MLPNNRKVAEAVYLSILLCVCGCIGLIQVIQMAPNGNLPIRVLSVKVEVRHRQELFDQLQKFAEKHDFRISIREVQVVPDGIFIQMNRSDLEIDSSSYASDPTLLDFAIHDRDLDHPTPKDIVDDLFNDLRKFISEVPNVVITEE